MGFEGEVRVGLAGCGRLAERGYLPALQRARGVRLVAVADPDRERRERAAPRVPGYDDLPALLAAGEVDALVLATPPAAHLAGARAAAQAGVPALVEKPPAADAGEAAELARLDPPPWIGFNRRFVPRLRRLRDGLPATGPLHLSFELVSRIEAWAPYAARADALLDLGCHLVDLARWLTRSDIRRARAVHLDPVRASFELELDRGTAAASVAHDRPWRELVLVRDGAGRGLGRYRAGGRAGRVLSRAGLRDPLVPSLAGELEALAAAVRDPSADGGLATAAEGAAAMAALAAVRLSAERGGAWEPVP